LLSQGRNEEALKIVQWIYRTNTGKKTLVDFPVDSLMSEEVKHEEQQNML